MRVIMSVWSVVSALVDINIGWGCAQGLVIAIQRSAIDSVSTDA